MSLNAADTIERFGMLPEGAAVLVALSGGADSVCLLHFLCAQRVPRGWTVFAAHVNHGIRGEEAAHDEHFCAALCQRLNVPFEVFRADVPALAAERGETLEQAGRHVRYELLGQAADSLRARLATAHTLSDSIETALLNFARGTGLRGLCGIPPVRGSIIRPLIADARSGIEAYCAEHGLEYVTDSTNFERAYSRNRLRLDAVPVLYALNPSFDRSALRAFSHLGDDEALLTWLAAEALAGAGSPREGYACASFASLDPALQGRAVAEAARRDTGLEPDHTHIGAIQALCARGQGRVQLPGGFFACAREGRLFFEPGAPAGEFFAAEIPLSEGVFDTGRCRVRVLSVQNAEIAKYFQNIHKQYLNFAVDCDKIIGTAVLRARRAGDNLRPAGRGVTKTLKKWMNETHVPERLRGYLPVAADEAGVLWAQGFGAAERCAADNETNRAWVFESVGDEQA